MTRPRSGGDRACPRAWRAVGDPRLGPTRARARPAACPAHRQRKAFCGRAMLTWAHTRGVTLRLIEPGKPNQTRMSNRSTAGSATSASTSTGSRVCPYAGPHRNLAARVQRGAAEAGTGRAHARPVRQAAGRGTQYSHPRTLNRSATEEGGTSVLPSERAYVIRTSGPDPRGSGKLRHPRAATTPGGGRLVSSRPPCIERGPQQVPDPGHARKPVPPCRGRRRLHTHRIDRRPPDDESLAAARGPETDRRVVAAQSPAAPRPAWSAG